MPDWKNRDAFRSRDSVPIITPENSLKNMMQAQTINDQRGTESREMYSDLGGGSYYKSASFEDRFGSGGSTLAKDEGECI